MIIILGFALNILFSLVHIFFRLTHTYEILVEKGEHALRKIISQNKYEQIVAGAFLTLGIAFISITIPWMVLWGVWLVHPVIRDIAEVLMFCYVLDIGRISSFGIKTYKMLEYENLPDARAALSALADWEVDELEEEEVTKTAIETIAKNINDGIFGPLFFMLIGGAPLAFFYKAIDIIDSIIGYQNERYLYFGRFVALINNFINFIPSRVAAGCMLIATHILKYDYNFAMKIFWRDRDRDTGYNNGQIKSVCAGALGIRLGGKYMGFGIAVNRPTIGDDIKKVDCWDIKKAIILMYVTSGIGVVIAAVLRFIFV